MSNFRKSNRISLWHEGEKHHCGLGRQYISHEERPDKIKQDNHGNPVTGWSPHNLTISFSRSFLGLLQSLESMKWYTAKYKFLLFLNGLELRLFTTKTQLGDMPGGDWPGPRDHGLSRGEDPGLTGSCVSQQQPRQNPQLLLTHLMDKDNCMCPWSGKHSFGQCNRATLIKVVLLTNAHRQNVKRGDVCLSGVSHTEERAPTWQ